MRTAIFVVFFCFFVFGALFIAAHASNSCAQLVRMRTANTPHACPEVIVQLPSDGSGVYHFAFNASLPIFTKDNVTVRIENQAEVEDGVAAHLIYAIAHPSCAHPVRLTGVQLNDALICTDAPYQADAKHAATNFGYATTHYGVKRNTPLSLSPAPPLPQQQPMGFLNFGNVMNEFAQSLNKQMLAQQNSFLQLGGNAAAGSATYQHNPFLQSLAAAQKHSNNNDGNAKPSFVFRLGDATNPFAQNGGSGSSSTRSIGQQPKFALADICGHSQRALIRGGSDVQPGEFPWLGGLFVRTNTDGATATDVTPPKYICTVNLVSATFILTAAHCIDMPNAPEAYAVLFGHPAHQRNETQRAYLRVRRIAVHPAYARANTTHDVAAMALRAPLAFSASLRPICVWSGRTERAGATGTVAGFGPDFVRLRKLDVPIVPAHECRASHVHFHYVTSAYTFCAGKRNNDGPCFGDSGAGFMQWIEDRFHLRGLVSHSLSDNGDCNLRHYVIFADLSTELDWLRATLVDD